ncbi:HAD-IIB family hydrolase [Pseudooceanicola aestuarii]|uniref:HAD-IIB family hydrolase n=1 Tax=Pseudooceanicola aestuarii TaxID=2697319 RepID=UPI0013D4D99F|nr:HAD-IIB family hydrolase [Pseudooceanicola aestuarii]
MKTPPFIVFTDLDGTLLDHQSYDYAPALPALSRLRAYGVPVVLASSKTAAEIAPLRAELRLTASPAIVENGAGLLPPNSPAEDKGDVYDRLRACLDQVSAPLREKFRGFGDLGAGAVALDSGLSPQKAELACKRAFSEPGLWYGTAVEKREFIAELAEFGVTARRGGRYLTLTFGGTKADRMDEAAALFGNPHRIALGDAPNDIEMLENASVGVVIRNDHGAPLPKLKGEASGQILRSTKPGPAGWNEMMMSLISRLTPH